MQDTGLEAHEVQAHGYRHQVQAWLQAAGLEALQVQARSNLWSSPCGQKPVVKTSRGQLIRQ